MLQRSGKQGAKLENDKLAKLFEKQLYEFKTWIKGKQNFSILTINYQDMIHSPISQCKQINSFLGGILNIESSATVIDPILYRNRV